ncbi:MAG: hypothetical protein IPM79_04250 [Polyangiaceae bacterium]|nr:hypothetical protein [Polyangiaceae bacterium]
MPTAVASHRIASTFAVSSAFHWGLSSGVFASPCFFSAADADADADAGGLDV